MITHTPGPWSVSSDVPTSSGLAITDARGRVVAIAKHIPQPDMLASACEANATLAAAAPAMLAALQWLRAEYCEGGALDGTEAERKILAAIAAATGEPIPSAPTVGD